MSKTISPPRLSYLIQLADAASHTKGSSASTRSEMRDVAEALRELEKHRLVVREVVPFLRSGDVDTRGGKIELNRIASLLVGISGTAK